MYIGFCSTQLLKEEAKMLARVTILFTMVLSLGVSASAKGGKIRWLEDPEAAMAMAKKSGKGMMLYFTSDG